MSLSGATGGCPLPMPPSLSPSAVGVHNYFVFLRCTYTLVKCACTSRRTGLLPVTGLTPGLGTGSTTACMGTGVTRRWTMGQRMQAQSHWDNSRRHQSTHMYTHTPRVLVRWGASSVALAGLGVLLVSLSECMCRWGLCYCRFLAASAAHPIDGPPNAVRLLVPQGLRSRATARPPLLPRPLRCHCPVTRGREGLVHKPMTRGFPTASARRWRLPPCPASKPLGSNTAVGCLPTAF